MIRVTIACPIALMADAAQFARATGFGPEDEATFSIAPEHADAEGNAYRVASGLVADSYPLLVSEALTEPEWGADMSAAARAQSVIVVGGAASPLHITAVINDDVLAAIDELLPDPEAHPAPQT